MRHQIRIVALLMASLLMASLLLASTAATAASYAPETIDRYFRVEFKVLSGAGGQALEGYIYNSAGMPAERMVVDISQLDASGTVVGKTSTRVLGGVPAGSRAWFQAKVPPAASYRVEIASFDWLRVGGM